MKHRRVRKIRPRELDRWFLAALKEEFPFLKKWDPVTAEEEPEAEITFTVRRGISPNTILCLSDRAGVFLYSHSGLLYSSYDFERTSRPEKVRLSHLLTNYRETKFVLVIHAGGKQTRFVLHKRAQQAIQALERQASSTARQMASAL